MSKDNEVFPTEFRHEVVTKFAKQFIDGSIKIDSSHTKNDSQARIGAQTAVSIIAGFKNYFDVNVTAEKRSEIEHQLTCRDFEGIEGVVRTT